MSIVPCGLVAWSLFNNTYTFSKGNNNESLPVNKRHISSKSDRDHKFGSDVFPKNFQNGSLIGGARLNESIPVVFTPGRGQMGHLAATCERKTKSKAGEFDEKGNAGVAQMKNHRAQRTRATHGPLLVIDKFMFNF